MTRILGGRKEIKYDGKIFLSVFVSKPRITITI